MRAGLLLCLLAAAPMVAAAAPPNDVVQSCASEAPDSTRGLRAFEQRCPALAPALEELGITPLLSEATREGLTPAMLADAAGLATAHAGRPGPDVRNLGPILGVISSRTQDRGWWARFVEWLRSYLGNHLPARGPGWLVRLLNAIDVSPDALRLVLYGLIALVIGAAGWILYRELKVAGLLQRPEARAARSGGTAQPATVAPTTLGALERLPAGERIGALFRLVLDTLEAHGAASARARTHRQLRATIRLPDAESARRFDELAAVAEQQLYAPTPVDATRLDAALAGGVALYGTLAGRRAS